MTRSVRRASLLVVGALLVGGCAGPATDDDTAAGVTGDDPAATPSDAATSALPGEEPVLPAPDDPELARRALDAMPDEVDGAARSSGPGSGDARYEGDGGTFGIEALDSADVLGTTGPATQEDLDRMVASPSPCEGVEVPCTSGADDVGQQVVVWTSEDGQVIYAAVAPTDPQLRLLLDAWRVAVAAVR